MCRLEESMDDEKVNTDIIIPEALNISQNRWERYIKMLNDSDYIKGVVIQKYNMGEKEVDINDICITLKGLEYLSENSIMQRFYKATKKVSELIP